jgi:predicted patatin/cPLA2 family phospholipase
MPSRRHHHLLMPTALVVEGGGMRGAYAAGALLGLHEMGVAFDQVWASSSSACSAAYYVSGCGTEGIRIWQDLVSGGQLIRLRNLLLRRPLMDLDYLIRTFRERVPLSWEKMPSGRGELRVVLTDCKSGKPVYWKVRGPEAFDVLRAATSLPFATRGYAPVEGRFYADGGITDSIPLAAALQAGASEITVILTHCPGYRMRPFPCVLPYLAFPRFPRLGRALVDRHLNYNASLDLIASPPPGMSLKLIRPCELSLHRFSRGRTRLRVAIEQGRRDARKAFDSPAVPGVRAGDGGGAGLSASPQGI